MRRQRTTVLLLTQYLIYCCHICVSQAGAGADRRGEGGGWQRQGAAGEGEGDVGGGEGEGEGGVGGGEGEGESGVGGREEPGRRREGGPRYVQEGGGVVEARGIWSKVCNKV